MLGPARLPPAPAERDGGGCLTEHARKACHPIAARACSLLFYAERLGCPA